MSLRSYSVFQGPWQADGAEVDEPGKASLAREAVQMSPPTVSWLSSDTVTPSGRAHRAGAPACVRAPARETPTYGDRQLERRRCRVLAHGWSMRLPPKVYVPDTDGAPLSPPVSEFSPMPGAAHPTRR